MTPYRKAVAAGATRPRRRDWLAGLLGEIELWHSPEREPFASLPVGGHVENWPVRSREFKWWLTRRRYAQASAVVSAGGLDDALRVIEARAIHDGPTCPVFLRVGGLGDAVYLDLGDPAWRAVEIDRDGWRMIDRPPVRFVRSSAMRALPAPEPDDCGLERLRPFLNLASDDDFALLVAFMLGSLSPAGPYPILTINGEQGSAKSTAARLIRAMIDPNVAPVRALPRDDRDLFIAAHNSWMLSFDNVSGVPDWLSDALCRLATGGGFATRELHSDRSETVFSAQRPIVLNGIPDLAGRPDLADRTIAVALTEIDEARRRSERELWAGFRAAQPAVLGALLDGVSGALRHRQEVRLERTPRMADFAVWAVAAEAALGWEAGTFLSAYRANRAGSLELAVENDPVASALRDLMTERETWEGSAAELLAELDRRASDSVRRSRRWPVTPSGLANALIRATPPLRKLGIDVARSRAATRDRKRLFTIGHREPGR